MALTPGRSYDDSGDYVGNSEGWSTFTPSGTWQNGSVGSADANTSRIIYVSWSAGSDSSPGDGSWQHPFKTIEKAGGYIRSGAPDWILLRKGDTWPDTEHTFYSAVSGGFYLRWAGGKSEQERRVYSSYSETGIDSSHPHGTGTGELPIVICPHDDNGVGCRGEEFKTSNIIIAHIAFQWSSGLGSGVIWSSTFQDVEPNRAKNILVEGVHVTGAFPSGIAFLPSGNDPTWQNTYDNIAIRRCVVYDTSGSGYICAQCPNMILDECITDNNGTDGVTTCHNHYFGGYNPDARFVTAQTGAIGRDISKGLISTQDCSTSHYRAGGEIYDCFASEAGSAFDVGAPNPPGVGSSVKKCVILHGFYPVVGAGAVVAFETLSNYVGDSYDGVIDIEDTIIAHSVSGAQAGINLAFNTSANITITNCTVDDWSTSDGIRDQASNATLVNNHIRNRGSGSWLDGNAPSGMIDASRTIETYDNIILGGPGTKAHYYGLLHLQTQDNWNYDLTANAINNYIREGYGYALISAGTDTNHSISPVRRDLLLSPTVPSRTTFIPPTRKSVKIHGPHYRGGLN